MREGIAVIGTIFVDYKGFARPGYQAAGRNLGRVEVVPGGVARNVAMNLCRLGVPTWFAGVLNQDGGSVALLDKMRAMGINTDYLSVVPAGGTGVWLALIGHDGELLGSVSQMPDTAVMEQAIIPHLPAMLAKTRGVALEVDLSADLARIVLRDAVQTGVKVYALPGNLSVIKENYDLFQYMECFVCNETEAAVLFAETADEPGKLLPLMKRFAQAQQLKNLVVTLGEKGALYWGVDGCCGHQPACPAVVVDGTGAGDAFFSGAVAALFNGKSLSEAVAAGAKVAALVIGSKDSDCSNLTGIENLTG